MPSRRLFLRHGTLAMVSLGFAPTFLARTAAAASAPRQRVLVAVFQRGAVDGLNMVVPHGDADYYRARRSIAVSRPTRDGSGAVDLDGFFGLHPQMRALHPLYVQGSLAIVHACGSPDSTRSHFDAQDFMESGTPGIKSTPDGWLNRYLELRRQEAESALRAVSMTPQMPRILQGGAGAVAMTSLARFGLHAGASPTPGDLQASFEAQYEAAADAVLGQTAREAFDGSRLAREVGRASARPANGAVYPRSAFGAALSQVAQLIKADVGLEVAFTDVGGWDTHANQGGAEGQLAQRLGGFANAIAAFTRDLGSRMQDVVLVSMSEFGRTVGENGNRGTDHGHGNAMLVVGGGVRGGRVYGRWPGLAPEQRHDGRDLAITTDFRDVFGEVITRHLGVRDLSTVFPGYRLDPGRYSGVMG